MLLILRKKGKPRGSLLLALAALAKLLNHHDMILDAVHCEKNVHAVKVEENHEGVDMAFS